MGLPGLFKIGDSTYSLRILQFYEEKCAGSSGQVYLTVRIITPINVKFKP